MFSGWIPLNPLERCVYALLTHRVHMLGIFRRPSPKNKPDASRRCLGVCGSPRNHGNQPLPGCLN